MEYKGYTIKGKTAYARGAKFRRYPSADTCTALRASWEIVDKSARYHATLSHLLLAVDCGIFVWDVYDAKTGKCGEVYEMVQL